MKNAVAVLRRTWRDRKYKRWRDLPIRASFVLYTLAAFVAGSLLCLIVVSLCNRVRFDLQNKYNEMSVSYEVPEGGSYDVHRTGRIINVAIYDKEDRQTRQFSVDLRTETLAYDAAIRASYRGTEESAPEGGVYMGSYYGPLGFVVTPRYTGEDSVANVTAVTISVLIIPASYIGALILCASLFYRRKLKGPILILARSSDRIARNDLDFVVAYDSLDEMGRLCSSFETMRRALVRNNRELWRSVEERRRLNAAFSHDLRTPLTVLKGHAAMLQSGVADGSAGREEILSEVSAMAGSVDRLERYVEAMTRLHRLEDVDVRREDVPFDELAASLRDTAQILCGGVAVAFEAAPGGTARVDREIVQQVFENIVANGARYALGRLEIRLWLEDDALAFSVRDDGPGFSPIDLEKATEPFYRGKRDSGSHMGLGLNICRILCKRHGGGVQLDNDGGAVVTARFAFEA